MEVMLKLHSEKGGSKMRNQPQHKIAQDAMKVWRIHAGIFVTLLWLVIIAFFVLTIVFDFNYIFTLIAGAIGIVFIFLFVYLLPKLRYQRWRYEIFEQEIYIQHGILIRKRTLVPMIRVQHVDTEQGPILKKFHLATVSVSTAAGKHMIPALLEDDASHLRDRISTLARVDEDDV